MEAKDTAIIKWNQEFRRKTLQAKLLEQAEISFKAGIKDCLQWLSEQPKESATDAFGMYILVEIDNWQAKLKEWGIEHSLPTVDTKPKKERR